MKKRLCYNDSDSDINGLWRCMMKRKIRFGIFGCSRGSTLINSIYASGGVVTALCDYRIDCKEYVYKNFSKVGKAKFFLDFDEFIKQDFDAVLISNYFCEHAKYAIKALKAGKNVLSETISNITLGEGVALCRAVEESGKTYALLENYPYFKGNMELEKIYKGGTLGKVVYAEGSYVHPMSVDEQNGLAPGLLHWRNWTPRCYYLTHALCPVLQMTDTLPVRVTAMASFAPEVAKGTALRTGDAAVIVMCQTDNDAVIRVTGWANFAPHGSEYRLYCTKGGAEVNRYNGKVHVQYNSYSRPEGEERTAYEYEPEWPIKELGEVAEREGHGGGDFWVIYYFIKALEEGKTPYWDVYRATRAASVAILGWRSVLCGGQPFDIPDFRKEEDRRKFEFDNVSPYPDRDYHVQIPCSSRPYTPTEEDLERTRKNCGDLIR